MSSSGKTTVVVSIAFALAGAATFFAMDRFGSGDSKRTAEGAGSAAENALTPEHKAAIRFLAAQRRLETTRPERTRRRSHVVPPNEPMRPRAKTLEHLESLPVAVTANIRSSIEGEDRRSRRDYLVARDGRRMIVNNRRQRAEILYVRNPKYGWEMTASVVDHKLRCVIDFNDTDIRSEAFAPDWVTIARLGVTDDEEKAGTKTGESRDAFGLVFEQRTVELDEGQDGMIEIWWNRKTRVPLLIRRRRGGKIERQETLSLRLSATPERLRHPAEKFSNYARMDISDFREKHVGCSTPSGFFTPTRGR